ncbi:MAG: PQQ-dependent sugar dehydrogenase [Polyangiaceae bacterium]
MRARHFHRFFIVSLAATAAVAACSDGGIDPMNDGGTRTDSGQTSGGPDAFNPPVDGSVFDAPIATDANDDVIDGSANDGDAADAGDASFDASDATDSGVVVVDGPDDPPVPFPTTTPNIFGYTLQDAFPGTFLSGAMDIDWPVGSNQPFVLQRGGHIVRLLGNGARTVVLDFSSLVAMRGEGGALGMALHPKFADAGDPHPYVYVWYNAEGNPTKNRLSRFTWNGTSFPLNSQLIMVDQVETATEHNAAHIRFGPDGFLYFGNGDDTRSAVTAQKLNGGLFSGIFRIDVDQKGGGISHPPTRQPQSATTQGYYIPNTNPFVGVAGANEEYYALGFRNPYGFNFDRQDGSLWQADVGDSFREEVNQIFSGGNYGWPYFEGNKPNAAGNVNIGVYYAPKFEYSHASIGDLSAVMGGYVYRGAALGALTGKYIFSDWPTGRVWALDTAAGTRTSLTESNWQNAPVGWGQDAAGELYLIAWSKILKLVAAPAHTVPLKLSETKIFRNLQTLKVPTAIKGYAIKSPLWSDGAAKQRWVYVPQGNTATMTASGKVTLPVGSMLIKQFDLPANTQPVGGRTRRLETRVLVVGTDTTYGLTYRWNAQGTDADLLLDAVDETIVDADPNETRTWHFPSQGECWSCHRAENRVIGFKGEQMNFGNPNQLQELATAGVFDANSIATSPAPLASPSDANETIEARASAYLAANCSSCHHPGASFLGGGDTWNALPGVLPSNRGLVNKPHHNYPMASGLGLPNAPLVSPGNPNNSILLARMKSVDADLRMPPLGRTRVDPVGVSVIEAWITQLPP